MQASTSQLAAWDDEDLVMRATLRDVCVAEPGAVDWSVIFEYELPLENGRRPDVIVLAGSSVVVLEFKQHLGNRVAVADQVDAYARDLSEYHEATHTCAVAPVLVITDGEDLFTHESVRVIDGTNVATTLLSSYEPGTIDLPSWLDSPYAPLPTLVAAARRIFQHEPLPAVRRALSTGIQNAVELLGQLAEASAKDGGRVLASLAGVPGSGKTLVGLTLVYERSERMSAATFLSGNGPLVEVLRDALQSKVFVRDLHAFIKTYGQSARVPNEHVIVFDEAQRAWDRGYMEYKHGIDRSEPDLLIQIGERLPVWALLVGLVGDGQEIHAGEEGGIEQWRKQCASELRPSGGRCTVPLDSPTPFEGLDPSEHSSLDLTLSLRTRRADRPARVGREHCFDGELGRAPPDRPSTSRLKRFPLYLTRSLDDAKSVRRASGTSTRRMLGWTACVRLVRNASCRRFGVDSSFPATKRVKLARWYNEGRGHPQSCCALDEVVTEFGCQGLELDLPIVCWGDDMVWDGRAWRVRGSGEVSAEG